MAGRGDAPGRHLIYSLCGEWSDMQDWAVQLTALQQIDVDLAKLNDSELDLNTSMMYRHEDYADAIRLVSEGKIRLKPLMSRHFAFRDFLKAYEYIDANREKTMKVIVDVQD